MGSYFTTRKMIKRIREEKPDIIHLHNVHGYYLHVPLFFRYLQEEFNGKIFWTFHDCWPFTGHCPYFSHVNCNRWESECYHCPQKKEYPVRLFLDRSRKNFCQKKKLFTELNNLSVIVPSEWMKQWVERSFMRDMDIQLVPNGIDLTMFHYSCNKEIYKKYDVPEEKIILGVANVWEKRKGLRDFLEIEKNIDGDKYQIILVGLSKAQIKDLPKQIIGITSIAEAMACGTPVIVLDTSAVKELVCEKRGIVLENNSVASYLKAIDEIEKGN